MNAARAELDLECEIVYLRALIAIAARDRNEQEAAALRRQLGEAGATHDERRRNGTVANTPMAKLAKRHALTENQLELVWAIVATTAEPRIAIPLEALWGTSARRGMSVAAYQHLRGLDAETGRDLALWLAHRCPLIGHGLVVGTEPSAPIASRTYVASERLVAHLVGDDAPVGPLRLVHAPPQMILDEPQQQALAALGPLLAGNAVIVIEGPRGSGRSTAVARASGRPVVELDGATKLEDDALVVLRREIALGVAQPVIANADRMTGLGPFLEAVSGPIVLTSAMPAIDLGTACRGRGDRVPGAGVDASFNAITVDGECSTNDTVVLLLIGASGIERTPASDLEFAACVRKVCGEIAKQIATDGEGVVVAEIAVRGAASESQAKAIAERVATSPLVKTALYGHDANWGRIAARVPARPGSRAGSPSSTRTSSRSRSTTHPFFVDGAPTGDEPVLEERQSARSTSTSRSATAPRRAPPPTSRTTT